MYIKIGLRGVDYAGNKGCALWNFFNRRDYRIKVTITF